jgi:hypothetical protein
MVVYIPFGVLYDSDHPTCPPLDELKQLIRSGQLPRLASLYGRLPGGDCSAIARVLMADLAAARLLRHEWHVAVADLPAVGEHSWVEADGWAFDLSHGDRRAAIVMRADAYRVMRAGMCYSPLSDLE